MADQPSRAAELAHAALLEVNPAAFVGEHLGEAPRAEQEEGVELIDVVFANTQSGYRGWSWVVTVAIVDGEEPTVLELGLLPGEDSLLSPAWVPWSVRLAEWQAQQAELAAAGEETEEIELAADDELVEDSDDDEDHSDDDDDSDEDEFDEDDGSDEDDDEFDDDDEDDSDDDLDDDDDLIDDPDGEPVGSMRDGDVDGVDIDSLDDSEEE